MDRLLTPKEVARIFRIRDAKIYGYIARGWLPAINVSTSAIPTFRIDPNEIPKLKQRLQFVTKPTVQRSRRTKRAKADKAQEARRLAIQAQLDA